MAEDSSTGHSSLGASFRRLFSSKKKQKDHHQEPHRLSELGSEPGLQNGHHHQPNDHSEAATKPSAYQKAPSKLFGRLTSSRSKPAEQQQNKPRRPPRPVPQLHACAMQGDLSGVLEAITSGADVNETVEMDNMQGDVLEGVSALFLAAQKNKTKVVKLLVENGANPDARVFFSKNKEHCTPAQIAGLNMNPKLAMYLRKAKKKARKNGVTFPQNAPVANGGTAQGHPQVTPTGAGAHSGRLGYSARLGYAPESYTPQSQIASDDALSDQATSVDPESRRVTTDGFQERRVPRTSYTESSDLPPTVEGGEWQSFYLNPGFNMDMRSPELEEEENKIDLNVSGLESRREHLRNLLNQSA